MKRLMLVGVLAVTAVSAACGGDDTGNGDGAAAGGGGTAVDVVAADFAFKPATLKLDPGEEVSLTLDNQGEAEHSFTSEELDVEVEAEGGASAETTFSAPEEDGAFEFFCEYHPDDMRGEILVGDAAPGGGMPTEDAEETEDADDGGGKQY